MAPLAWEKWAEPTPVRHVSSLRPQRPQAFSSSPGHIKPGSECTGAARHASSRVPLSAQAQRATNLTAGNLLPTTLFTTATFYIRAVLCLPAKTADQTPAGLNLRAGAASWATPRCHPPRGLARPSATHMHMYGFRYKLRCNVASVARPCRVSCLPPCRPAALPGPAALPPCRPPPCRPAALPPCSLFCHNACAPVSRGNGANKGGRQARKAHCPCKPQDMNGTLHGQSDAWRPQHPS